MSESRDTRCVQSVYVDGRWRTRCSRPGKLEHAGKLYCAQHHPPTVAARNKAKLEERAAQLRKEADAYFAAAEREGRQRMAHGAAHDALKVLDPAWHAALERWIANGGEMPRRGA